MKCVVWKAWVRIGIWYLYVKYYVEKKSDKKVYDGGGE